MADSYTIPDFLRPGSVNAQEQRERDQRWCDSMRSVIDAVLNGVRPHACPWGDKRFQELILHAMVKAGKWRRDAEKLAVIRDVFGGGK